jgi:hypothetical protein
MDQMTQPVPVQEVEPKRVDWQVVGYDHPSTSAGEGTEHELGRSSSRQGTSGHRRNQQRANSHHSKEAASRQHQLLNTCVKVKDLCYMAKFETTPHTTIM